MNNGNNDVQKGLEDWFRRRFPGRSELQVSDFARPNAGASNETLLFDLSWQEQGVTYSQGMVARLKPLAAGVFPEYDLELQYHAMERLAGSEVRVPVMLGLELDESVIGKPFFIMERLEGRYMADNPPYHLEGWLTKEPPQVCAGIWRNAIKQMAAVSRVDWQALGFAELWDQQQFATPLMQLLDYYEKFLRWSESLGRPFPKLEPVLDYLKSHQPKSDLIALCWGDAKPPNLMVAESGDDIVALLDWEMVHLGDPVHDLAWWMVLDDSLTAGIGVPKVRGLPDRQEMISLWEQESGRSADNLDYYELLSNFQFAVIMHRIGTLLTEQGMFRPEDEFDINNNTTLLIDAQIEKFAIPRC